MRISIGYKLIVSYLFISTFTAISIYLLTYFTSEQRIHSLALDYQTAEMSREIYNWYEAERGWQGFPEYFHSLHPPPQPFAQGEMSSTDIEAKRKRHGIFSADNKALLRYLDYMPGESVPKALLVSATPITFEGKTVAWIIPPDATGLSLEAEFALFLDNFRGVLLIAVGLSIGIALVMGIILAKVMLRPVNALTKAARAIAQGRLEQSVKQYADDEIGELSRSFNKMSQDLVDADKHRRQLTADITHDLGTPIQVISGYIEMAQEGDIELTSERVDIVATELARIKRLLQEMSLLAQTDARTLSIQLTELDITSVMQRVYQLYQQPCKDKAINLILECEKSIPLINLDEDRIIQVLENLLSNAMRYTPPDGRIVLRATIVEQHLQLQVDDNGEGIDSKDLPYVFDRFYRADTSRYGQSGEMGLGLSISKSLVEILGGEIKVQSDGKTGTIFTLRFPLIH